MGAVEGREGSENSPTPSQLPRAARCPVSTAYVRAHRPPLTLARTLCTDILKRGNNQMRNGLMGIKYGMTNRSASHE